MAQKTLPTRNVLIIVDNRELGSNVVRHLQALDVKISSKQLQVGDYICSDRVGIERKTIPDFLQSVFDQRIFKQLAELSDSYTRPVLILEGNPDALFMERRVNPNTIRGVLGAIAVDYQIPIIWTGHSRESAAQIYWIAMREQVLEKREMQIRVKKKTYTLAQQQEFLVSGLPGISTARARQLLKAFKTPEKVFTASEAKLGKLEGFGEKRIRQIKRVLKENYSP